MPVVWHTSTGTMRHCKTAKISHNHKRNVSRFLLYLAAMNSRSRIAKVSPGIGYRVIARWGGDAENYGYNPFFLIVPRVH